MFGMQKYVVHLYSLDPLSSTRVAFSRLVIVSANRYETFVGDRNADLGAIREGKLGRK